MSQKLSYKTTAYLRRHTPIILSCMGAIGVVATAVIASKAATKASRLLEDAACKKGEKLTKLETIQIAGPAYIPAVIVGIATISCVFGANALNQRQQASLTSAYGLLSQSYRRYRNAANSVYGEDADLKIKAQMAEDTYLSADGFHLYIPEKDMESEKILFFDYYSNRYFTATMPAVLNAQYHINRNLMLKCHVSINEFYDFLGIEGIAGGDDIGWDIYEMECCGVGWLDFENRHVEMDDGVECIIVSPLWEPDALIML